MALPDGFTADVDVVNATSPAPTPAALKRMPSLKVPLISVPLINTLFSWVLPEKITLDKPDKVLALTKTSDAVPPLPPMVAVVAPSP